MSSRSTAPGSASRLLSRLRDGKSAHGAWLFMGSPDTAEVLGHVDFDARLRFVTVGSDAGMLRLGAAASLL